MSADNYYLIRKDRQGFYVPVMGFASDQNDPIVRGKDPRFKKLDDALDYAHKEYTEYGVDIHPECHDAALPTLSRTSNGHFPNCWAPELSEYGSAPCVCDRIETDWWADYTATAK